MKRVANIAAKILTGYLIALPMLFGFHSLQHEHDCVEDHNDDLEYAQSSTDCSLCDLYQDQAATTEIPDFHSARLSLVSLQLMSADILTQTSEAFKLLRGPPAA